MYYKALGTEVRRSFFVQRRPRRYVYCGPRGLCLMVPWGIGKGSSDVLETLTLRLKIAQQPYIMWSLGPKALKCEALEP